MFTDYTGEVTRWLPFLVYKAPRRRIEKIYTIKLEKERRPYETEK